MKKDRQARQPRQSQDRTESRQTQSQDKTDRQTDLREEDLQQHSGQLPARGEQEDACLMAMVGMMGMVGMMMMGAPSHTHDNTTH
jgi:hypothetical protein